MKSKSLLLLLFAFVTISNGFLYSAQSNNPDSLSIDEINKILASLSREKYFPYQDILINNNILWRGTGTNCSSRYKAIYNSLNKLYENKKEILILDIGANNGYFSIRLAQDFNAKCVMVDLTDRLNDICKLNINLKDNLFYIKNSLISNDLLKLADKIHFDVVIILNVLHHIPEWKEYITALFKIANTIIIETPPSNDPRLNNKTSIAEIEAFLESLNGEIINETPRTIPGYFDNLEKMEFGKMYQIPTLENVKSKMFLFNNYSQNNSYFRMDLLKEFGLIFP